MTGTLPFDMENYCLLCGAYPEYLYGARKDPLCNDCVVHIRAGRCTDDTECTRCGYRDCPDNEPLHYDDDGCPMCS